MSQDVRDELCKCWSGLGIFGEANRSQTEYLCSIPTSLLCWEIANTSICSVCITWPEHDLFARIPSIWPETSIWYYETKSQWIRNKINKYTNETKRIAKPNNEKKKTSRKFTGRNWIPSTYGLLTGHSFPATRIHSGHRRRILRHRKIRKANNNCKNDELLWKIVCRRDGRTFALE